MLKHLPQRANTDRTGATHAEYLLMAYETGRRRAYLREYQLAWVKRRRNEWIADHGPCAICGSWDQPEVDHIDRSTKVLTPAKIWSLSPENPKRIAELAKCQVLCHDCHQEKTSTELASLHSGVRASNASLTSEKLTLVRSMLAAGIRGAEIARQVKVSEHVVSRVKRGESYRY